MAVSRDIADQGEVVTIGADDAIEEALEVMKRHKIRRLPVVDGTEVIGFISQGDLARHVPPAQAGDLVATVGQRLSRVPRRSGRYRFFTALGKSRKWS
jgi:CBS domain-containing protein